MYKAEQSEYKSIVAIKMSKKRNNNSYVFAKMSAEHKIVEKL